MRMRMVEERMLVKDGMECKVNRAKLGDGLLGMSCWGWAAATCGVKMDMLCQLKCVWKDGEGGEGWGGGGRVNITCR